MTQANLPSLPEGFQYRLDLRHHVTPHLLREKPVHRWFFFPHSFSPQLLDEVLQHYPLPPQARILDPFVGAGTTVLRARELGYSAVGTDLSPLSVFVSRIKLQVYDRRLLQKHLLALLNYQPVQKIQPLPERVGRAFTQEELRHLLGLRRAIDALPDPAAGFFRLALLRLQQQLSRAVPNGGWFRWVEKPDQSEAVADLFAERARRQEVLDQLPAKSDPRVARMLKGYFEDMYLVLRKLQALPSPGGVCVFVVGNVRYAGVMVPVDEIFIDVAQQVGFTFDTAWVARLRGNSAQQMGRFRREPARESVVCLRKC